MKPGFLTSEFWVMIAKMVVTVLIAVGVISADKGDAAATATADALTALGAFIANAWVVISYIHARKAVKQAAIQEQSLTPAGGPMVLSPGQIQPTGAIPPFLVNLLLQTLLAALPQLIQLLQNWLNNQHKATQEQVAKLAEVEARMSEAMARIGAFRASGGMTP